MALKARLERLERSEAFTAVSEHSSKARDTAIAARSGPHHHATFTVLFRCGCS